MYTTFYFLRHTPIAPAPKIGAKRVINFCKRLFMYVHSITTLEKLKVFCKYSIMHSYEK